MQLQEPPTFATHSGLVLDELQRTLRSISATELQASSESILSAQRVFFTGAGRSGLALKMAAMRMMHLGLHVYVTGEITTPAIGHGDLLVIASGSGTTASAVQAAQVAKKASAKLLVITTAPASPLGTLADVTLTIPAATKQAHGGTLSQQYAGSLFEQTLLLTMDILFHEMWHQRGESAQQLWARHANLE
jgi:6-phospho-3-hexuloisomerase